ncbi:cardiolipin synthase [Arsenicitalea aurantiaca]|uniref:Cardiolipin synthase n=2 Tax=Arsenicitalea aurantiaca TaxID=1783274 RepID=A0A433XGM4_9HYPH|nr:cardiolipin synthase [Arsenicitalea aurantiaca]
MNSRTSQGSIAWIMALLVIPFPTAILYLIFGWKFFDDYGSPGAETPRGGRPARAQDLKLFDMDTTAEWPVLTRVANVPFLAGNAVDLLVDGKATFDSIFEGISKAESYIFVQFYILRDDRLGQELADRLIERAKAGVRIYVLYDDLGSLWLPLAYRKRLRAEGIQIAGFNQRHKFFRFYGPTRLNYRNHRKIVLVDGKTAWVGGHNVGVEYLGADPKYGHWRDTHVKVDGPAALACGLIFREDWEWATGEALPYDPPNDIPKPGRQPVMVMATGPADALEECAIAFTDVIAQSRSRLWIASPYFVPDADVRTALYAASLRGVDVRIMLPDRPDKLLVWLATNAHADTMIEHGIEIHRYRNAFLHQKVVLMDDRIASVGTVNFDNRSFNINFELTLWFPHPRTVKAVETMLTRDFEHCRRQTLDQVKHKPVLQRFIEQGAKLLSPVL